MAHWIGLATGITLIGGLFVLFKEELKDEWYKLTHKQVYVDVNTDEHVTVQPPKNQDEVQAYPVVEFPLDDINDDVDLDLDLDQEKLSDHKCNCCENCKCVNCKCTPESKCVDECKCNHENSASIFVPVKNDEDDADSLKVCPHSPDSKMTISSSSEENKSEESKDDLTPESGESDSENDSPHFDEEDSGDEYSDTESE
jgi:hypothetical protein